MKRTLRNISLAAAMSLPLLAQAFVPGPTSPGKWGSPVMGTGATVTWSLMRTISSLGSFMPAGYLTEIQAAFSAWSAVANINFVQVADDGAAFNAATTSGDMRFGGHFFDGVNGTLAHGFFPPGNGFTAAGDMHFDTSETWKVGFGGPGFSIFQVAAHEIGHAIGLGHTAVPSSLMNPFYTEAFAGPQADDIAGGVFIYGAPVPEPSGYLLAFAGLGLAWVAGKRKKA
jgi:Matrixin